MSGNKAPGWLRSGGGLAGQSACVGVLLALSVTGCADHRISLTEFLEVQRAMRRTAPTTQPAVDEAAAARLDEHLGPYKVGPSDVLLVTLTGAAQVDVVPPTQVRIDRNGDIELPIVGSLKVADLELEDVEDVILNAYVPDVLKDAVAHVELVTADTAKVLVTGAVTNPGIVPLQRNERNMFFAIVGAGGVSEVASGRATLRRIRRPGEEVTLDLTDPIELKAAVELDPLEDGDIITVEAATPNTIFVGGLVNAPGPKTLPPGTEINLLQALVMSGGVITAVNPTEATLIRRMPDGTDVHVKLDLERLKRGQDPNILLAAGDILWVPETFGTRALDFVNRNFFFRAGVSVSYDPVQSERYRVTETRAAWQFRQQKRFGPLGAFGGFGRLGAFAPDPLGFLTPSPAPPPAP